MKQKDVRLLFMGTPAFAESILAALIGDNYNIVGVFAQPAKKSGRKQALIKNPVAITAAENNIPFFSPEKLDAEVVEQIKKLNPDLIVVAAYGKIIPQNILDIPRFKALNVHPSLLPKFRGASPIQNAILKGEKVTGTTIMQMDAGMDTGDILSQEKVPIDPDEKLNSLTEKLAVKSSALLLQTIPLWIAGKIIPQKQNSSEASYCQVLTRENGQINWNSSAQDIYNQYRAFSPWPGIYSFWQRKDVPQRIILHEISFDKSINVHKVGEVFRITNKIGIQAANGAILLSQVQLEGKGIISIESFTNGYPDFVGSILQ